MMQQLLLALRIAKWSIGPEALAYILSPGVHVTSMDHRVPSCRDRAQLANELP